MTIFTCKPHYWAVQWRSENKLDGYREHLIGGHWHGTVGPILFRTRREAREWRNQHYGYIANSELEKEPHGWKLPRVLRVKAMYEFV